MFETKNLSIGYKKYLVQSDLNLSLNAGEFVCLIGPNGCGKSTLLRTISGLQKPLNGNIFINNKNINNLRSNEKAQLVSFVLTDRVNIDNLPLFDLVFTGRYPHTSWLGNRTKEDIDKTTEAIRQVNLTHKIQQPINQLSDGERQRAMIAKALAQDTPLLFLDEPTAHLDLVNRVEILFLLRSLAKETGKTIVLSTHELELSLQIADHIWLMQAQGIISGVPEDLMLQGAIQNAFPNPSISFDNTSGAMQLLHTHSDKKISISGNSSTVSFATRALLRTGFNIIEDAPIQILAKENSWLIGNIEVHSIEELLQQLL